MSDEIEWGPWTEHDHRGCPVPVGTFIEIILRNRDGGHVTVIGAMTKKAEACPSWVMKDHIGPWNQVIRYRIRKPRRNAMDRLAEIAANPSISITAPEGPTREKVPANNTRDRA